MTRKTENANIQLEEILGVRQVPIHANDNKKRTTSPSGKHFPKKFTVPVVSNDYMT